MVQKKFRLSAKVSSDNPPVIKPVLDRIFEGMGTVKETDQGFEIDAELEGESAVALNRTLLSELRRAEKKTRLRSQWTSGNTSERFFDYVLKATLNTVD
jgi:ribosomal protein L16/L10AE